MSLSLILGVAGFPLLALAILPFQTGRSIALYILYRIGQVALLGLVGLLSLFLFLPETAELAPVASRFDPVCAQLNEELPGYCLAEYYLGRWLVLAILLVVVGLPQLLLINKIRTRVREESKEGYFDIFPNSSSGLPLSPRRPLLIKDVMRMT